MVQFPLRWREAEQKTREGVEVCTVDTVAGKCRCGALLETGSLVLSPHALGFWSPFKPAISPTDPQTPENSKTQKSYSKVTFGLPAKVTQKLLKSDSKVTKTVQKATFESLLSNF